MKYEPTISKKLNIKALNIKNQYKNHELVKPNKLNLKGIQNKIFINTFKIKENKIKVFFVIKKYFGLMQAQIGNGFYLNIK